MEEVQNCLDCAYVATGVYSEPCVKCFSLNLTGILDYFVLEKTAYLDEEDLHL